MNLKYRLITRAALLLALTLIFQSLRFIIPIPPFLSIFLIGSLVNACLLIAAETVSMKYALFIGGGAPIVAYFQQLLPLPIFIIPVMVANFVYIGVFLLAGRKQRWLGVGVAAVSKFLFIYAAFAWLLTMVAIPGSLSAGLMFAMSWPQLITGIMGGLLSGIVTKRLQLLS